MGKYTLVLSENARKELRAHYRSGNKPTIKQIERIFIELANHPHAGIGQPEKLKYKLSGYWSRRLNKKDRIIYRIEEKRVRVIVVSAKGHYTDR